MLETKSRTPKLLRTRFPDFGKSILKKELNLNKAQVLSEGL